MKLRFICLLFIILTSIVFAQVNTDSQWRGPYRTGHYPDEQLLKQWPSGGPKLLWAFNEIGEGYSSPAVTDKNVYVAGMVDEQGYLFKFNLKGKLVWKLNYGPEWSESYPGSRSTPTVVDDKIYLMTSLSKVYCIDATKAIVVWTHDMEKLFSAENLRWGMTESLLVDGDVVYCTPGGPDAFIAVLNRHTGETVNTLNCGGEKSAYCSPVLVKHGEKDLLLTMSGGSLVGFDPNTGKMLWKQSHRTKYDINPNTPIYFNNMIYTVSGYGTTGSQMFKLSENGEEINLLWKNETLDSQMGAAVIVDGYIYGSGHRNKGWHCLDTKTGNVKYTSRDLGKKGNIIYADGLLYCYDESGKVGLVRPNPNKFDLISSVDIDKGSGQHWSHPVISNGRLYVRHGDTIMVFEISRN